MRWFIGAGLVLVLACSNDDEYGVVELEFTGRSAASAGTVEVAATMQYLDCLVGFYDGHPELRQDGTEGASIFAEWEGRLCDGSSVSCSSVEISQNLDVPVPVLTVEYAVSGDVDGRGVQVGPFPTSDTAGCQAEVHMRSVVGRNAEGVGVWTVESFSSADAVVGQGAPISVTIGET